MLRIATHLARRGVSIDVYTISWLGESPEPGINVKLIPTRGLLNHLRYKNFIHRAQAEITAGGYDLIVGFNRMSGLDVYFAADPCFVEKAYNQRSFLYRLSGRYRWFSACEKAIFAQASPTQILLLAEREKRLFQRWYGTADERFHLLPPYLSSNRMQLQDRDSMRQRLRNEFGFCEEDNILLLVGSGFRTKGLDRAIDAVAALPTPVKSRTRLIAVGQDNPKAFQRLINERGLRANVRITPGRDDIPQLMQGADVLIHPARRELAGHVLLEAMASRLPVLVTDVCGYATHVQKAGAGLLLQSPFSQHDLNSSLMEILASEQRRTWGENGYQYAQKLMAENNGGAEAEILIRLAQHKQMKTDSMSKGADAL